MSSSHHEIASRIVLILHSYTQLHYVMAYVVYLIYKIVGCQ